MWIGAVGGALWNYRIDSAGDGLAGIRMGENTTFVTSLSYLPGRVLWRMPAKFSVVKVLGRKYSLRCVLFHHISDQASPFTDGLGVNVTRKDFEARIRFCRGTMTPLTWRCCLQLGTVRFFPRRPVLVTFDDAYASVAEVAAPICRSITYQPFFRKCVFSRKPGFIN